MKTNHSAIDTGSNHRANGPLRTFLRRRLTATMRFAAPACLLMAASFANAGQPLFTPASPAVSPVAISPQMQSGPSASASSNQALMNQLIGQLNQRQMESRITAAAFGAQRPIYLPQQTIRVRQGK